MNHYLIYHALQYYGYHQQALAIAVKTNALMKKSGNREYYHSESGTGVGWIHFRVGICWWVISLNK